MRELHHRQQDQNPDVKKQPNWITRHRWLIVVGLALLLASTLFWGAWPKQSLYISAYVYTQNPYAETGEYNQHTDHHAISLGPKVGIAHAHGGTPEETISLRYNQESGVSSFPLSTGYGVQSYFGSIPKEAILQWLPDVRLDQDIPVNFRFFNTSMDRKGYEGHLTLYFWEQNGQLYARASLAVVYTDSGLHQTDQFEGLLTEQGIAFGFEM